MRKRHSVASLVCALALTILVACGESPAAISTVNKQISPGAISAATATTAASAPASSATEARNTATAGTTGNDSTAAASATSTPVGVAHATEIMLNGNAITVEGKGVTVKDSTATITDAGTYSISGALADGQIIMNTKDKASVILILNGVTLSHSSSAPIYIMEAQEAVILLAEGSKNSVSDGESYVFADPAEDEPNAAIFSKADLIIQGGGSLTVTGNYNDGIASKDGLTIASGTVAVISVDDGIRGKDYLIVNDGNITVNAGGDGLKSDNAEDATLGYISIENGVIQVTSGGDAITAETGVTVRAGQITLSSGGGYKASLDADTSAKGIKGVASVVIDGGYLHHRFRR